MGTKKRHLLVLAIASLGLQVNSSVSLGQALQFIEGVAPVKTVGEPGAPPEIESWLLGEAKPISATTGNEDANDIVVAQFSEMESVAPGAVGEASLPQPGASSPLASETMPPTGVSMATPGIAGTAMIQGEMPISSDGMLGSPGVDSFTVGEMHQPPLVDGYVDQMAADNTVHFSSLANYRRGYWYSEKDVVMMLRTEVSDLLLSFDPVPGSDFFGFREDMSITDADFTFEPGLRVTIGRMLGQDMATRDFAFEFSYLGLFQYEGSSSIGAEIGSTIETALGQGKPQAGLQLPVDGFSGALRHTVDYQGDFDSVELNYKVLGRPKRDRLAMQPSGVWVRHATPSRIKTGLIGLRYVALNDYVQYRSFFANPSQDRGTYLLRTQNDMFGFQIGGTASEVYSNWSWGVKFKTGALINLVNRNSEIFGADSGNTFSRSQFVDDEHLAVSVDAGFNASYQFRPNMAGRIGYDLMYITGVAVGSNNMDLAPEFPKLDLTGDTFMHGLSIGLDFMY